MLPKKHRGLSSVSVGEVMDGGRTMANRYFRVFVLPSSDSFARFAAVVSKSVAKSAVDRNRLRRRMYAVVESTFVGMNLPIRIVILAKQSAIGLKYAELSSRLCEVFLKLQLEIRDK
jgi:ribonuclease P protein component